MHQRVKSFVYVYSVLTHSRGSVNAVGVCDSMPQMEYSFTHSAQIENPAAIRCN